MTFFNEGSSTLTSSVQDNFEMTYFPVSKKPRFFYGIKILYERCLVSEQVQNMCRWPHITSVQCIEDLT